MTVRVAAVALLAMAALVLGQLVVALYKLIEFDSILKRASTTVGASAADVHDFKSDQSLYGFFFCGLLIFFVGFIVMAAANSWLGRRAGQVMGIICSVALLFCFALSFMPRPETKLEAAFANAEPSWAVALDYASLTVTPLAALAIVLLLTRSARQHFSWLPPAPPGYMWAPAAIPWPYQDHQDR
jgi:hypothetical protein